MGMENAIMMKDWRKLLGNRLLEPKERNTANELSLKQFWDTYRLCDI
jgi:hypothetical protein